MPRSISERLTEVLPQLPKAERRVARLLLSEYPIAGVKSVAQLAEQAQVSGPTVLRLAKRMGFDGFPEFREAMWREMHARVASPLSLYPKAQAEMHVIARADQVFSQVAPALASTLSRDHFDHAVSLLSDPKQRVFTAGGRFTRLAAQCLALHLEVLRPNVQHVDESDFVRTVLDACRSDVLVVFDVRRYQHSVIDFGERAAEVGVNVIVVTDAWMSPVAASAKSLLVIPASTLGPFDSLVPSTIVAETIVGGVVERLGDAPRKRMERYDDLWSRRGMPDPRRLGSDDQPVGPG